MLLRWLIRKLCVTPAEMRVVLRSVRAHAFRLQNAPDDQDPLWTVDRRITQSVRLSLLTGLLVVHLENPRLFATAWIALPLAILLSLLRIAGSLR